MTELLIAVVGVCVGYALGTLLMYLGARRERARIRRELEGLKTLALARLVEIDGDAKDAFFKGWRAHEKRAQDNKNTNPFATCRNQIIEEAWKRALGKPKKFAHRSKMRTSPK